MEWASRPGSRVGLFAVAVSWQQTYMQLPGSNPPLQLSKQHCAWKNTMTVILEEMIDGLISLTQTVSSFNIITVCHVSIILR